jgi:hypothetical protein
LSVVSSPFSVRRSPSDDRLHRLLKNSASYQGIALAMP